MGIDDVFDQILNSHIGYHDDVKLKDVRLNLEENDITDDGMGYIGAYLYLRDYLEIESIKDSNMLLDLFLVHQYLCHAYLSEENIDTWPYDAAEKNEIVGMVKECFSIYRVVGAYEDCIRQYEILSKSRLWQIFGIGAQMQIMKDSAKSYRNTGDFGQALQIYYKCLEQNPKGNWIHRMELLLKIGKVYRNYLMQTGLAKFYCEEAMEILETNGTKPYQGNERRYAIIGFDTLGQIYRDEKDYPKAELFFRKSEELSSGNSTRARIHRILMKYSEHTEDANVKKDILELSETISHLKENPLNQVGAGIRSIQLGQLMNQDKTWDKKKARDSVKEGWDIANRYNDIKSIIKACMALAEFALDENDYESYISMNQKAIQIASENRQMVLENEIIKGVLESPAYIDSSMRLKLIKRRKEIYVKLVEYSKLSIDIAQRELSVSFSPDKLIELYKIVLADFEQIFQELNKVIEILNIEFENINKKYIEYLNTEIEGNTYKNILHKFKNNLPDRIVIDQLKELCGNIQLNHPEESETLMMVSKQLDSFADIVEYIRESSIEVLSVTRYEKNWCPLDELIREGIDDFKYSRQEYKEKIQYDYPESEVMCYVQRKFFETTFMEILNNAFVYAKRTAETEKTIEDFSFIVRVNIDKERTVYLECFSRYDSRRIAENAAASIRSGLEKKISSKGKGGGYGFYSIRLLFEDFLNGRVQVLHRARETGLVIHWPIDGVVSKINEKRG